MLIPLGFMFGTVDPNFLGVWGNSGKKSRPQGVAVDAAGNVYQVGDMPPPSTDPDSGIFVVKYNPLGMVLWQRRLYSGTGQTGWAIAVGASGAVYVTGSQGNFGSFTGLFVAKYDSAGSLLWQKLFPESSSGRGIAISVREAGNQVLILGKNPSSFLVFYMLDTAGALTWKKVPTIASAGFEVVSGGLDSSGNCYANGIFNDGTMQYSVISLTSTGTLRFSKKATDPGFALFYDGAVDSAGNFYAAGRTGDAVTYRPYVAKFDSSGSALWQKTVSSASSSSFEAVASDPAGNVYTYDYTWGEITKFNSSGVFQWGRRISGALISSASLAADQGFVYLAAYLSESRALLVKLPVDGSKLGTYVVGGVTFQISDNSQAWIDTSRTYTSNTPTIADASGTMTTATFTDEAFAPTYDVKNF